MRGLQFQYPEHAKNLYYLPDLHQKRRDQIFVQSQDFES